MQMWKHPGSMPKKVDEQEQVPVIIEGFVDFDYEITLLTVRHSGGRAFVTRSVTCRLMEIIENRGNLNP